MKNFKKTALSLALLAGFILTLNSCNKDNPKTFVKVKVTTAGILPSPRAGVPVYMFLENHGPSTSFFRPIHSRRQVITENNGIATFELGEMDLHIINSQTTFHFGVFGGTSTSPTILGTASVTIKEGETKEVTISY